MQFVARRGTHPRTKAAQDGGDYRNIDNFLKDDQQDQLQVTPNGSYSPFFDQQNMDYLQRGNGAGILVNYDDYGYEGMDAHGGAFSGSQPMPHTATFYPESKSQQHPAKQMKQ